MMQVILLERIEKLGQMGETVTVRPGYARNFLLPQKKALRATKSNLEFFESQRSRLEAENLERRAEAQKVADKIEGTEIIVVRAASDTGALYGSVAARDIVEGLEALSISISRVQVALDSPIKEVGIATVRLRLHAEVSTTITVNIARSLEEAEQQKEKGQSNDTAISEDDALAQAMDFDVDQAIALAQEEE